jgi:hypothetical protein
MNIETLERLGGKRWQRNGSDRVYFNDLALWLGLRVSTYGTGNVSAATLNGEPISNGQAKKLLSRVTGAKFWFDAADGAFHWQFPMVMPGDSNPGREIAQAIRAKAVELEAANAR